MNPATILMTDPIKSQIHQLPDAAIQPLLEWLWAY